MEDYIELGKEQKEALRKTVQVGRLYGIVLLFSVALTLGLHILSIALQGNPPLSIVSSFIGIAITVAFGILLLFFARYATEYFRTHSSGSIEKAYKNLRWFFVLRGVLYLVVIVFIFLFFLAIILLGAR